MGRVQFNPTQKWIEYVEDTPSGPVVQAVYDPAGRTPPGVQPGASLTLAPELQTLAQSAARGDPSAAGMLDTALQGMNVGLSQKQGQAPQTYTPALDASMRQYYNNLSKTAFDMAQARNTLATRESQLRDKFRAANFGDPGPLAWPSSGGNPAAPTGQPAATSGTPQVNDDLTLPDYATFAQSPAELSAQLGTAAVAMYIRQKQREEQLAALERQYESRAAGASKLEKFADIRRQRERQQPMYDALKAQITANPGMDKSWIQVQDARTGRSDSVPKSLLSQWEGLRGLDQEEMDLLWQYAPEEAVIQRREELRGMKEFLPDHVRASWDLLPEPPQRFAGGGMFGFTTSAYAPPGASGGTTSSSPATGSPPAAAGGATQSTGSTTGAAPASSEDDGSEEIAAIKNALDREMLAIANERSVAESKFRAERAQLEAEAWAAGLSLGAVAPGPVPSAQAHAPSVASYAAAQPVANAAVPIARPGTG